MGAFELNDNCGNNNQGNFGGHMGHGSNSHKDVFCDNSGGGGNNNLNPSRLREENIIAMKIYDSCRRQDCLTIDHLGGARAAESVIVGDFTINEGDVICPPHEAASVSIDKLKIKKVMIVDKEPNNFKKGYWDIELKFVFEYRLIFREADGCIIGSVKAHSMFNKKLMLFGSEGADLFMATDMFKGECDNILGTEPFVHVEAKAMSLNAELVCSHHNPNKCEEGRPHHRKEVAVTIGLFFIVKLFRIVDLRVESRGFAIPKVCKEIDAVNPCDFFDNLSFPMDVFAPPQKPEFLAGVSGNIPAQGGHKHSGNHVEKQPRDIRDHNNKENCC